MAEGGEINVAPQDGNDIETFSVKELKDLIPNFDGEQALLNDFIEAVDFAITNIDEGQEKALIFLIKSKLVGKAKIFISSRNLKTWEEIKPLLVGHFGDCRDTEALIRDLTNSFQKHNETPRNFVQKIESLSTKLRSSVQLDDTVNPLHKKTLIESHERIALKTLLAGLSDPLGQMIRAQRPETISDAAQYILEEENIAYLKSSRHQNQNQSQQSQPRNFKSFPRQNYHNQSFTPRANNSQSNQDVKFCTYCKKPGHLIANCFKRINNEQNHNQFNRTNNTQNNNPYQPRPNFYQSNFNQKPKIEPRINHLNEIQEVVQDEQSSLTEN